MTLLYLTQGHRALSVLEFGDETPDLVLALEFLSALLEVRIEFRKPLPELFHAAFEVLVRNEEGFLHVLLLHPVARNPREYDELADYVHSAEVDARIRLRIALFLRHPYGLAERDVLADGVEDEVEGSAEDGLYLEYVVAAVAQGVDGGDYRKSGSHIGFEKELDPAAVRRLPQAGIGGEIG